MNVWLGSNIQHISLILRFQNTLVFFIVWRVFCLQLPYLHFITALIVLPHLMYCNIIWSDRNNTSLGIIHIKLKKTVRICTNSHYLAHSPPLFADLNTLTVQAINKLQAALFMYKYHNNLLPDIFTDYFVKANTIHGYNTRQSYMYRPCYFNTHLANNSIKRQGPLIWSSARGSAVPPNIRDSTSVFSFKTKFKAELISRY